MFLVEEAKWRSKPYKENESILDVIQFYEITRGDVKKGQQTKRDNCHGEMFKEFLGKAKYFVSSGKSGEREIEVNEAF